MSEATEAALRAHGELLDEHETVATRLYIVMANRARVYLPTRPATGDNEYWKRRPDGELILTPAGFRSIDEELQKQAESQLERARNWVAVVSPILSLALAALAIVWKSPSPDVYVVMPPDEPRLLAVATISPGSPVPSPGPTSISR